jgi:SOS-response transcriptional repressor LexA
MIEISHAVGLSSPNATRSHLLQLEKQGKIRLRSGIARSIVLVD